MQRAEQKKVANEANLQLVNIRTAELLYFSNFFSTFGIQAAVMVAVVCGSISQTPAWNKVGIECDEFKAANPPFWRYLYFIATSATLVTAMNVLLSTVFINIFGHGLALRGPGGSMVRAIAGMVEEQYQILASFLLCIVFYSLMVIGMFFQVMDGTLAPICVTLLVVCLYVSYHYTLRIYNRFQIPEKSADWRNNDEDEFEELDPTLKVNTAIEETRKSLQAPLTNPSSTQTGSGVTYTTNKKPTKNKNKSFFQPPSKLFFGLYGNKRAKGNQQSRSGLTPQDLGTKTDQPTGYVPPVVDDTFGNGDDFSDVNSKIESTELRNTVFRSSATNRAIGHYLSYHQASQTSSISLFSSDQWQRRYFVIKGSVMFYYHNKQAFQDKPGQPINKRGIDLEGYTVKHNVQDSSTAVSTYLFQLVIEDFEDNRRDWQFRADTQDEYGRWISLLTNAIKDCTVAAVE